MKIGLIDLGGHNFPNLPLMKISAWHKRRGDKVEWYDAMFTEHCDKVYISKVFSWVPDYPYKIDADEIISGGTGYAIKQEAGKEIFDKSADKNLPDEIEHIYPDYSLYPNLTNDTAYGFLTRGCPRNCSFCIVSKKEGKCSRKVADLDEFWSGQRKIVLNDPNILACKEWEPLLLQIQKTGAEIDFNQGLDIRLMTEEKARLLGSIKIKEIHFAWDKYEEKDLVLPRLEMFAKLSKVKPHSHRAIVYTIVNFDTTIEQDLDRIYTLRDMGYWPYVMIYNKRHAHSEYKRLQRWVNMRSVFATVKRFEDYKTNN